MKEQLIDKLSHIIRTVPLKAEHLSLTEWSNKPKPDKWSKKEILGHLIDSALNNLRRFSEIQFKLGTYQVIGYEQDHLVRINNYQGQNITHLLQFWSSLNRQIAAVWEYTNENNLDNPIILPDLKTNKTLGWLMEDYINHLNHHLGQIFDHIHDWARDWPYRVSIGHALQELDKVDPLFVKVLEHGSMEVEIYIPEGKDLQQPHSRDELYIVISGHGTFVNGDVIHSFQPGDVLFVPAGVAHRFENFSEDFRTWVIFYGPEGGEAN